MITIYANWTGNALASGATLDAARAKLTALDCLPETVFGTDPTDVTALDTGPHVIIPPQPDRYDLLHKARPHFAVVSAEGLARPITYTLAIGADMLLATVLDGGDITDQLEEFEAPEGGPRFKPGDYEIITGCTLTDDEPEDADRIVWTSGHYGWLCDTSGRNWRYAVRT